MAFHETTPLSEDELSRNDETWPIRAGDRTQQKYPGKRSGGMRKRVGLARSLVLKPEVSIYDEPMPVQSGGATSREREPSEAEERRSL